MNRPLILIAALGVTAAVVGAVVALLVPGDDDPEPRSTPSVVAAPATGSSTRSSGPSSEPSDALEDDGTLLVSHGRGASVEGGTGLYEQVSIGADAASRTLTTGVCPQDLPRYQCGDGTAVQSQWRWDSANQRLASISR